MKIQPTILCTSYFPPIQYFKYFTISSNIFIEHKEYYKRHSIRNRTLILGPNNPLLLTVPIVNKHYSKTLIENVKIADSYWKKKHINSIQTAYGSSPYFIFYFDIIKKIILKKNSFLIDLNYDILHFFLEELEMNTNTKKTDSYIELYENNILDQRNEINIKTKFKKYNQIFNKIFTPNLSILDLIFNLGPNAKEYIHEI
ncbi:MAG: hypothetical protein CMP49_03630 [Flavobacteriales bacterium]|nr:hypothetical protein [Flavobacteriales bacterium]|tara:strand:- start:3190 stop:3789 length:600 start_codon:yes stop_codon:yes gene_type:complete